MKRKEQTEPYDTFIQTWENVCDNRVQRCDPARFVPRFLQCQVIDELKFSNSSDRGQLHDDVILRQLPQSFSLLFSCANYRCCCLNLSGIV